MMARMGSYVNMQLNKCFEPLHSASCLRLFSFVVHGLLSVARAQGQKMSMLEQF